MRILFKYGENQVKYYYYRCVLKAESQCSRCNEKNINGVKADQLIIDEFKKFGQNEGLIYDELMKKYKYVDTSVDYKHDKSKLLLQIEKHNKSIENLAGQIADGSPATKYLLKKIEDIDKEINELKKQLNTMEEKTESSIQKVKDIQILKELITEFASRYDELDIREQRQLLKAIIS